MNLRKLLALTLLGGLFLLYSYAARSSGRDRFEQTVRPPSQSSLLEVEKLSDFPLQRRADHYQLQFVSESLGWLYSRKTIWRTQDGGRAWTLIFQVDDDPEALKKGAVNEIAKIQFINERIGWMSMFRSRLIKAENGSLTFDKSPLLKSEDGGLTWNDCLLEFKSIADFCFLADGQRGYVAGSYWDPQGGRRGDGGSSCSHVFQTTDGGKTWVQPASGPRSVHIDKLVFIDEGHGWALFPNGIYRFENGQWAKKLFFRKALCGSAKTFPVSETAAIDEKYSDQGAPLATAYYFINANEGWVGFLSGDFLHTRDGGQTWCHDFKPGEAWWIMSGLGNALNQIYFSDSTRGWVRNTDGELYKTEDGGVRMVRVNAGVRIDYMHFLNAQCGWAIAKEGIFRLRP